MTSNSNKQPASTSLPFLLPTHVELPLPPTFERENKDFEYDVYQCFIKHLRQSAHNRTEMMILSAIEATGANLQIGAALVSRILCDIGLRAPRRAFPLSFLDFVEKITNQINCPAATPACIFKINDYWRQLETTLRYPS